jgi:hypothetical protein
VAAKDKNIVYVAAKTPKAAMLAKTLVQNAVDAVDARRADIRHVDNTNNGAGDDVIAAPDAVAMQSTSLAGGVESLERLEQFDEWRVPQLRAELKRHCLPSSGAKRTLIARLEAHTNDGDGAGRGDEPDNGSARTKHIANDGNSTNNRGGDDVIATFGESGMQSASLTSPKQLHALVVAQLRAGLKLFGLPSYGSKEALIARLAKYANDVEDGAEASLSCFSLAIPVGTNRKTQRRSNKSFDLRNIRAGK